MDAEDIIDGLGTLFRTDCDAIRVYDRVIHRTDDVDIRSRLEEMREEHEQHLDVISMLIRDEGGEPPERSLDFRGRFMDVIAMLGSQIGTSGALRSLEMAENYVSEEYVAALQYDWPPDIRKVIETHQQDEQKHLSFIQRELGARA